VAEVRRCAATAPSAMRSPHFRACIIGRKPQRLAQGRDRIRGSAQAHQSGRRAPSMSARPNIRAVAQATTALCDLAIARRQDEPPPVGVPATHRADYRLLQEQAARLNTITSSGPLEATLIRRLARRLGPPPIRTRAEGAPVALGGRLSLDRPNPAPHPI